MFDGVRYLCLRTETRKNSWLKSLCSRVWFHCGCSCFVGEGVWAGRSESEEYGFKEEICLFGFDWGW